MQCANIMAALERLAPLDLACEWDNPGLLVGRKEKTVKKVYVTLDVTDEEVAAAIDMGADMIISHHPLIFHPLKKVTDDHFIGRRVYDLIRHDICCYGMHTNYDIAPGCMGDLAAARIALLAKAPLEVTAMVAGAAVGIGKTGSLQVPMTLKEFALHVKQSLALSAVTVYGDLESNVILERAAISPGAGKSMVSHALAAGAEVLVTGDIGHQEGLDAWADGLAIIDGGHYGTEYLFVPCISDYLKKCFGNGLLIETAGFKEPNQVL